MELLIVLSIIIVAITLGLVEYLIDMYIYAHSKYKKQIDEYFFSSNTIP